MPLQLPTALPSSSIADPASTDRRTAPAHLRSVAYLYGLDTAELAQARVLELGCGMGLNLLPFALAYPQAQVVGVDINAEHVEAGQGRIAELGVGNYQLFAVDLQSLLQIRDLGAFDYIIVRGVFSLMDAQARLATMEFCQAHLSPEGVACFDYPTYPGARGVDMLRDALLFHSSLADEEQQKLDSARAMLAFLNQGLSDKNPFRTFLARQVEQAEHQTDLMLSLRYLQGFHHPCHFIEFHDLAQQSGLAYVGDASPHTELPESWGKHTHTLCATINPNGNKVLGQQYLDFACGRSSRLSIVAHQALAERILPGPDLERLKDLRWSGYFMRYQNDDGHEGNGHLLADGTPVSTENQVSLSILDNLGYAWPCSLDYENMAFNSRPVVSLEAEAQEQHPENVRKSLSMIFMSLGDHIRFSREATPYDRAMQKHVARIPGIWEIVETPDKAEASLYACNYWQERIELPLSSRQAALLPVFDGENGPRAWVDVLSRQLRDEGQHDEELAPEAARFVLTLKKYGLLQGASTAWTEYHRAALDSEMDRPERAAQHVAPLMMHTFAEKYGGIGRTTVLDRQRIQSRNDAALHQEIAEIHRRLDDLQLEKAEQLTRNLVKKYPDSHIAWYESHRTLLVSRRFKEMLAPALQALQRNTENAICYNAVALSLRYQNRHWLHKHLLEKTLRLDPRLPNAWDYLGNYYSERLQVEMATLCSQRAAELAPDNEDILSNLAGNYSNQMRLNEALDVYKRAVKINPNKFLVHSNYLFVAQHSIDLTSDELFRLHREYGKAVEKKAGNAHVKAKHDNDRNPDRPLKIGFVSGDLRNHAVAHFLEPFWAKMDRHRFGLYAYQAHSVFDGVSERLRNLSAEWRNISDMTDKAAADLIKDDRVDILIDLSGHTAHNRLPMFAYKPAPVQMTWIGYPGTTGLEAMDYKLVAKCNAFGNLEKQFTEKLILVPDRVLFKPDANAPDINGLPFQKNGYLTFGSFNRAQKFSERMLSTWAEILRRSPEAKLLIANMTDQGMLERFRAKFEAMGFGPERVEFRHRMSMEAYLRLHHEVDVLLDTFPYNGGTTTGHGLWMGVPILTLAGDTLACRHGVPWMTQYGLTDFIAYSIEEYIEKAVGLGAQREQLAEIRRSMRTRLGSDSHGVKDQVVVFERALHEAWQRWCANSPVVSFEILDR